MKTCKSEAKVHSMGSCLGAKHPTNSELYYQGTVNFLLAHIFIMYIVKLLLFVWLILISTWMNIEDTVQQNVQ